MTSKLRPRALPRPPSDSPPAKPSMDPGPAALERVVAQASSQASAHELAWQEPAERRFVNVSVTREDKEALDAVQAWWSYRQGRRVPHWELFNLVLAEALQNERGRFYRMTSRSWV